MRKKLSENVYLEEKLDFTGMRIVGAGIKKKDTYFLLSLQFLKEVGNTYVKVIIMPNYQVILEAIAALAPHLGSRITLWRCDYPNTNVYFELEGSTLPFIFY